jgi:DNA-binding helix-hairpin-helix protein with protein kinase domain
MPAVDLRTSVPMFRLYNPRDRLQTWPGFTWDYLLRTAANLAGTVRALHGAGYVVGDLNESNVLVTNTALTTLVDCDSMQAPSGTGRVYRCLVGKAEYTPPELQGRDFGSVDRSPSHDAFGLGVLVCLLLMEGVHPFQGIWRGGGTPPVVAQHIRDGNFALTAGGRLAPPPYALPVETLPPVVQALVRRCFLDGHRRPAARPSAAEWQRALAEAQRRLTRCPTNRCHVFSRHLAACPWCERVRRGLPDPFPPVATAPAVSRPRPAAATPRRTAAGQTTRRQRSRPRRPAGRPAREGVWQRFVGLLALLGTGAPAATAPRARRR